MNVDLERFNKTNAKELIELHEAIAKYKANAQFRQENEFCVSFLYIGTTMLMPYDSDNQPLSVQDYQKLKIFDILLQSKLSKTTYDFFSMHFDIELQLGSLYQLHAQIAKLSHVLEYSYNCCMNNCCCFVGPFINLETCVYCGHQHLKSNGTLYKIFQY